MSALDAIIAAARRKPARIVLPEGEDARIVEGAVRARADGFAHPVLLGDAAGVARRLRAAGADASAFEIIDPATSDQAARYAAGYHALRQHRGVDEAAAAAAVRDPLVFAAMMVREGDADATIGGAVATTAATVRAALQIIGRAEASGTVSSFFLMLPGGAAAQDALVFADCGMIVEPSVDELVRIAIDSAASFTALTGEEPRVAMLSFSTHGSARHPRVSRMAEATAAVRAARPDLILDGEMQFDAAFVPSVAASKAPDSPLGGRANVFVFPSLEAGNIGYKIAQRIGGAVAIGPVLQGLKRPANDLSRGCSADDVYHLIAVTGAQAAAEATG